MVRDLPWSLDPDVEPETFASREGRLMPGPMSVLYDVAERKIHISVFIDSNMNVLTPPVAVPAGDWNLCWEIAEGSMDFANFHPRGVEKIEPDMVPMATLELPRRVGRLLPGSGQQWGPRAERFCRLPVLHAAQRGEQGFQARSDDRGDQGPDRIRLTGRRCSGARAEGLEGGPGADGIEERESEPVGVDAARPRPLGMEDGRSSDRRSGRRRGRLHRRAGRCRE